MLTVALSPPPLPPLLSLLRRDFRWVSQQKIAITLPPSDRPSRAFVLPPRQLYCDTKQPLQRRESVTVAKINVLF